MVAVGGEQREPEGGLSLCLKRKGCVLSGFCERLDLRSVGFRGTRKALPEEEKAWGVAGVNVNGDGCFQVVADELGGGLEAFGKIGFKSSGLDDSEQNLGFSLFEFQAFFSLIQATRQVAHAEGYEEEDREHEGIFWLGDVKGETGRDEQEVPDQRAEGG